jgi:hypothetical protein
MAKLPPLPPVPRPEGKGPRNMAERSKDERKALGRKGGLAAQAAGKTGKRWSLEEARAHGRAGGRARKKVKP